MQHDLVIKNTKIQDKVGVRLPLPMGCVAANIGSSCPATSKSDFIEIKTKVGGILEMSMTKESTTVCSVKFLLCLANNKRPHVVYGSAVNLLETSK
jgi:hypothetical protein